MRTTKLFATILVAGLIASACQQDPDYVLPAIKVESEELNFAAETEQALAFTATRDWRVQDAPEWVTVVPDKGSGSQETQRVRVSVAPNTGYNRSGEFVLTIGLDKARVTVSQPGAKGEVPVGTGTKEDPYTVAAAIASVANLTWTSNDDYQSTDDVYVKGKISRIADNGTYTGGGTYGNASFYIKDEGSDTEFYVFRALYLGNKKFESGQTDIKVGDEVVICGKLMNYHGNTPETVAGKAYLYSLNGTTEAGSGGQGSGGGGSQQQSGSIFSQAFKDDGQGSFTIEDKVSFPEGVTYVWSYDNRYGMKASAYANNANFASESWLVSPAIDLSSAKNPILTFRHALNYFTSIEKAKEEATVWAKPEGGEWAKLSGVIYPESLSWTFIDSGEIDLVAYVGKKIQIGFKYVSTADKAGTWEIDSFEIKEK